MNELIREFAERGCAWHSDEYLAFVTIMFGRPYKLRDFKSPAEYDRYRSDVEAALLAVDGSTDPNVGRQRYWAFRWWTNREEWATEMLGG